MAKTNYAVSKFGIGENEKVLVYKVIWFEGFAIGWKEKEYKSGYFAYKFANQLAYTNDSVRLEGLITDGNNINWVTLAQC